MTPAPTPPAPTIEEIVAADPRALGRAITLVERGDHRMAPVLAEARRRGGRAFRVGFTGAPGVGKSSLLREVTQRLRAAGARVAVVASDPVSPITGGALLGDRCRMADSASEDGVFFRSVAHRSEGSGLSAAACGAADLLDASGFSWILVETVGTGQADSAALRGASLKVLVHTPDSGDEVQMLKAGIVETADLHVVTKCDRPGARAWASELETTLGQGPSGRGRVFPVSSITGEGVAELVAELIEVFKRSRDGAGNVKS